MREAIERAMIILIIVMLLILLIKEAESKEMHEHFIGPIAVCQSIEDMHKFIASRIAGEDPMKYAKSCTSQVYGVKIEKVMVHIISLNDQLFTVHKALVFATRTATGWDMHSPPKSGFIGKSLPRRTPSDA